MRGFLLAALLAIPASAQVGAFNSACFGGLNDADTPAVLGPCESPDLLNVESNLKGTAILKRKGYALSANLTVSTSPVTGSHSFIDSSGNRLDIVCQDRNCAKSTNGNAFSNWLSTAASGVTRWSFVDVGGVLYGGNNKYDPILKYDGSTLSYPAGMPKGSILELTQDRLVIGEISGSPNRVHYSSGGAYEQFTTGANFDDSFFDDVGAPGDKIRGLKYFKGNLYIFKTASLTSCELGDQYTTRCSVLIPNLGTTDPASIITAGDSLYFRGQDKNYWEVSGRGIGQISAKIPNLIKSQSGGLSGGENSNTQTTQADWENGTQSPSSSWDTVTIPGSIFPSSSTLLDATTADFALGTCSGCGVNSNGYVQFAGVTSTYTLRYDADAIPTNDGWSRTGATPTESISGSSLTAHSSSGFGYIKSANHDGGISSMLTTRFSMTTAGSGQCSVAITSGGVTLASIILSESSSLIMYNGFGVLGTESFTAMQYSTYTIIVSSGNVAYFYRNGIFKSSGTAATTGAATGASIGCTPIATDTTIVVDYVNVSSGVPNPLNTDIVSVATFTSRIFDTTVSTPTFGSLAVTSYPVTGTTLSYSVRTSTSPNDDLWGSYESVANAARPTAYTNRYVQYRATFTHLNFADSPGITRASLPFATTGQFSSQCIQPNSSISAWGTLSCAQTLVGGGSHVFFATSAATCATLPTTDPTAWATTETNNATLTVATNTAVKYAWRSLLGSSTDQAQVDACTLAWNEGTPAQPAWAVYDSIKNAVYWTTTINNAASSNRLLKYDRNLEQWYPFDIPAQAPRFINNSLYFGGASSGTWNQYGLVDSDIGGSINAYWKSKDIGSDSPFQEKDFKTLSILSRNNQSGSMTGTYTYSNAQAGSYSISLSTGAGINYARSNFNLPISSPHEFMNVKIGNNSSTPFEVLGLGLTWSVKPWRVSGP